jgi:hypothetical protein
LDWKYDFRNVLDSTLYITDGGGRIDNEMIRFSSNIHNSFTGRQILSSSSLLNNGKVIEPRCCFYSQTKIMSTNHSKQINNANSMDHINTTATKVDITKSHYETHSAKSYESAYFYEVGPYMQHLRNLCHNKLQLDNNWENASTGTTTSTINRRILLDIGGGTGTFTRMLIEGTENCEAIVIDPFLEQSSNDNSIQFIKAPAEAFINITSINHQNSNDTNNDLLLPQQYHQILMKEVAHHFATQDRIPIFRGMYHGLIPTSTNITIPSILLITRPQTDIDYPLWDAARDVWKQNQPSVDDFIQELHTAGFVNVQYTMESYPCSISLKRWQGMIQSRFWSTFANFTDEELNDACDVIATNEKYRITDDGIIHFEDRLLFITGCKKTNM